MAEEGKETSTSQDDTFKALVGRIAGHTRAVIDSAADEIDEFFGRVTEGGQPVVDQLKAVRRRVDDAITWAEQVVGNNAHRDAPTGNTGTPRDATPADGSPRGGNVYKFRGINQGANIGTVHFRALSADEVEQVSYEIKKILGVTDVDTGVNYLNIYVDTNYDVSAINTRITEIIEGMTSATWVHHDTLFAIE